MEWDPIRAYQHLLALLDEHGLCATWETDWEKAESWPAARHVVLIVPTKPKGYLVSLHEIGHCVQLQSRRLANRKDREGELACESWAWSWAAGAADTELTAAIPPSAWVGALGSTYGAYVRYHATAHETPAPPR